MAVWDWVKDQADKASDWVEDKSESTWDNITGSDLNPANWDPDVQDVTTEFMTGGFIGVDNQGRFEMGHAPQMIDETLGEITGRNLQREALNRQQRRLKREEERRRQMIEEARQERKQRNIAASQAAGGRGGTRRTGGGLSSGQSFDPFMGGLAPLNEDLLGR